MADQYTYTADALLRHIDCLWDEWAALRTSGPQEIRSHSDPGIQSDLPVVVADVRRAWDRAGLDATERQVFVCRHYHGLDLATIGEFYEMTPDEVALLLDATYQQLLDTINGGNAHG